MSTNSLRAGTLADVPPVQSGRPPAYTTSELGELAEMLDGSGVILSADTCVSESQAKSRARTLATHLRDRTDRTVKTRTWPDYNDAGNLVWHWCLISGTAKSPDRSSENEQG